MALSIDSIIKLPTPKKVFILMGILCVITGIYFYTFFLPQRDELRLKKDELSKFIKELNESRAIVRDLEKFKGQVKKLNEELDSALTQLPNEKEIPEILKTISSLGKDSNLEFTLFRPKPEEPQQFYAKVPIELIALGSYHNMGIFFDKVSKLSRIINVVDFNMSRAKDVRGRGETDILVKTSCLMNTYRFIENKITEKKSEERKSEKKEISKEAEGEGIPGTKRK
jgi:type IV pilus assembly protein PilO